MLPPLEASRVFSLSSVLKIFLCLGPFSSNVLPESLQSNSCLVILGSFLELFSYYYYFFLFFLSELLSWILDFTNISNFLPWPPFHLS